MKPFVQSTYQRHSVGSIAILTVPPSDFQSTLKIVMAFIVPNIPWSAISLSTTLSNAASQTRHTQIFASKNVEWDPFTYDVRLTEVVKVFLVHDPLRYRIWRDGERRRSEG